MSAKTLPTMERNLLNAARNGDLETVERLVKIVRKTPRDRIGQTPISLAAEYGHLNVVRCLTGHGADLETKSCEGWTPLSLAAADGELEIVRFLADHGADLETRDRMDRSPVSRAALYGHLKVVEFLTGRGADMESVDIRGHTAISLAVSYGHVEIARFLKEITTHRLVAATVGNLTKSAARRQKNPFQLVYISR